MPNKAETCYINFFANFSRTKHTLWVFYLLPPPPTSSRLHCSPTLPASVTQILLEGAVSHIRHVSDTDTSQIRFEYGSSRILKDRTFIGLILVSDIFAPRPKALASPVSPPNLNYYFSPPLRDLAAAATIPCSLTNPPLPSCSSLMNPWIRWPPAAGELLPQQKSVAGEILPSKQVSSSMNSYPPHVLRLLT